jgi:hypothetical protein
MVGVKLIAVIDSKKLYDSNQPKAGFQTPTSALQRELPFDYGAPTAA